MSKVTHIQWCDSSANVQMGCEGCELVKGLKKPKCYAKVLVDRYKGLPGWPENFETPKIFMERIPKMLVWADLTGVERPDKSWLKKLPRLIFLNDMGDTFSDGMPIDWFKDVLPSLHTSPHQYLVLTKWPKRFLNFSYRHKIPDNVWPGTTITSQKTVFRANSLIFGRVPWLSIEPLWGMVNLNSVIDNVKWVIVGGESGPNATPCELEWIMDIIDQCRMKIIPVFVKQLGSYQAKKLGLKDSAGGDWNEWPAEFRIREMPKI